MIKLKNIPRLKDNMCKNYIVFELFDKPIENQ